MKKWYCALFIVMLIGVNIVNLNTVVSVAPQKNSKLQLSQNMVNPVANDLTYHTNIEPAVPAEPPEMEFETLDNVLDPGSGANGWSLSNPPPAFNILRQAISRYDTCWDLTTEEGVRGLSTHMLTNKNIKVIFTFKGEFLVPLEPNQNNEYIIVEHTLEFSAWVFTQGDMNDYLQIQDIFIDGVEQKRQKHVINLNELLDSLKLSGIVENRISANGVWAGIFTSMGIFLISKGLKYVLLAVAAIAESLKITAIGLSIGATALIGTIALWVGIACVVVAIIFAIRITIIANNG